LTVPYVEEEIKENVQIIKEVKEDTTIDGPKKKRTFQTEKQCAV
jgi:hypothetical protein